jgi:hypothetical protein
LLVVVADLSHVLVSSPHLATLQLRSFCLIQKQVVDLTRDPSLLRASSMPCVDTPDSRSFCMVEVVEDASMIVINRIRDGKDHTPTQTDKCVTYIASHHYSFNFKGIIN